MKKFTQFKNIILNIISSLNKHINRVTTICCKLVIFGPLAAVECGAMGSTALLLRFSAVSWVHLKLVVEPERNWKPHWE